MAAHEPQSFRSLLVNRQHPRHFNSGRSAKRRSLLAAVFLAAIGICLPYGVVAAAESAASKDLSPRPSGYNEAGAAAEKQELRFQAVEIIAAIPYDLVAQFPKDKTPAFEVKRVTVNGA